MSDFSDLNVTVYVTGSIACYKTLKLIRLLKKAHANVKVVMSYGAQRFISPVTFQAISGGSVIYDQMKSKSVHGILHVDLARWTDVAIIMPATANVIAKAANGIADGIVSTCLLATSAPKIMVPAMNNLMFINPATQRNLQRLNNYPNYYQWGPVNGKLAEGYLGLGRMLEPRQVVNKLNQMLNIQQVLKGTHILVTAGGTQEPVDPVRFITNGSSGKMGYSIARRARQLGAKVTLISGHTEVPVPQGVELIKVKTTEEMSRAVLKRFPNNQILIMSAALADFAPVSPEDQKIKKTSSTGNQLVLNLKRTPDVLSQVARIKQPRQITVGFAAETQDLLKNAIRKLKAKRLNLIVANNVAKSKIGFGANNNQVTFINDRGRTKTTSIEPKFVIADQLLKIIAKLKDDRS